jgi:nucleoside phosphorylase
VTSHNTEPPRRAVILTALELEHSSVTQHLSGPLSEHDERGLLFDVGTFEGQHRWAVAAAQGGPGNLGAGILLERAVTAFRPDVAFFVGIAGGRKDVRHGDVVVADAVYDYETGKAENTDFLPRIKTFASSFGLVQRARAVARQDRWQASILPTQPTDRPAAFVKPIAAGSKVIAGGRSAIARFLTHNCGDAVAVDMESYGFLHGAYVNSDLATLVVRGISDLLDDKTAHNDRDWQVPAANNAAAFAFAVLERMTLDRPPPHDQPPVGSRYTQTNQPGAGGTVYAHQGAGDQIIQNRAGR